jgi:hypothetical protein
MVVKADPKTPEENILTHVSTPLRSLAMWALKQIY